MQRIFPRRVLSGVLALLAVGALSLPGLRADDEKPTSKRAGRGTVKDGEKADGESADGEKPEARAKRRPERGTAGERTPRAKLPEAQFNKVVRIGQMAPRWRGLEGTDGKKHGFQELKDAKAIVVAFTCNGCPVAKAYEERMSAFAKDYAEKGVPLVAISVQDSIESMREKSFAFPYLLDTTQQLGHRYGATVTPHFFVLDGKRRIAYMGAFDDNQDATKASKGHVRDAVDAVLAGKAVEVTETRQFGCGVKYTTKPEPVARRARRGVDGEAKGRGEGRDAGPAGGDAKDLDKPAKPRARRAKDGDGAGDAKPPRQRQKKDAGSDA